jgi:hypothetical protein
MRERAQEHRQVVRCALEVGARLLYRPGRRERVVTSGIMAFKPLLPGGGGWSRKGIHQGVKARGVKVGMRYLEVPSGAADMAKGGRKMAAAWGKTKGLTSGVHM